MRNKFYTILFSIWSLIIISLTSYPKLHNPLSDKIWNVDKLAHFTVYAIFSLLFVKMNQHKTYRQNAKSLLLLALIIPLLDELHQIPIPGRSFSVYDIIADIAGFALIIIYCRWRRA
ncbi:MAG: VanZ family protein [Candidatus Cloacimonadales bacterium]